MTTRPTVLDWRSAGGAAALLGGLVLIALICGWLIADGHVDYIAAVGIIAGLIALAVKAPGPLAALLVLAELNGIPGVDVAGLHASGSFNPSTACAVLLALIGGTRAVGHPVRTAQVWRWASVWSGCFLGWWLVTWIRAVGDGAPLLKAATFGQAFFAFGLLLPVSPWLLKDRRDISGFLKVIIAFTVIYAIGEIGLSLGALSPSVINVSYTVAVGTVTRVYAPMSDAVVLLLAVSVGVLLVETGRIRRYAIGTAIVSGTAVALGLTRAEYFGLAGAVVLCVAAIAFAGPPQLRARVGWRAFVSVLLSLGAVAAIAAVAPHAGDSGVIHQLLQRTTNGLASLSGTASGFNTLNYRENLDHTMLGILGSRWPVGLGFLPPPTFYFSQLPSGSIINTDVGVLSGLMTMGAIGTTLLYLPLVAFVGWIGRGLRHGASHAGIRFGLAIWGVATIVTSSTLYTLFSTGGLTIAALTIGIAIRALPLTDSGPSRASAPRKREVIWW